MTKKIIRRWKSKHKQHTHTFIPLHDTSRGVGSIRPVLFHVTACRLQGRCINWASASRYYSLFSPGSLGQFGQYSFLCANPPAGFNFSISWNVAHPKYCNCFITCGNGAAIPACHICAQGTYFPDDTFTV